MLFKPQKTLNEPSIKLAPTNPCQPSLLTTLLLTTIHLSNPFFSSLSFNKEGQRATKKPSSNISLYFSPTFHNQASCFFLRACMAFRCVLVLLLLALAVVVESSTSADSILGVSRAGGITIGSRGGVKSQTCNGLVGDCIDEDEEMGMESESTRRVLKGKKYISYGALNKNNPPCKQRGSSYYGCGKAKKVNPYKRGCSAISHCERYLN